MAALLDDAIRRHREGDLDGAISLYQQLIDADPGDADAWHLMGVAAHQQGKNELAAELIETAISIRPDVADFHSNLGQVHQALGDDIQAEASLRRALDLDPDHTKALSNLAALDRRRGDLESAASHASRAVAMAPGVAEARVNQGNIFRDAGLVNEAIAAYRAAIERKPDYALAHWNLALALLLAGNYPEGFAELGWRWRWSGYASPRRDFGVPQWDGASVDGKTVLIHTEQGLGDAIQLVRYARLVAAKGARVIVECPAPLVPWFETSGIAETIIAAGMPLPQIDFHVPLFDLPVIFETTLETVPAIVPYLRVDADLRAAQERQLTRYGGWRVGLNWVGNSDSPLEKFRRLPLDHFTALAAMPGIHWVSLQKGPDAVEAPPAPGVFKLIDTGPEPIAETAALIDCLDLVITSDTVVAHMAGALGKPVWLALHHAPDWRWGMSGVTSPWYPTARLFRQRIAGDWTDVAEEMRRALERGALTEFAGN